jgi:hypothetical protein
MLEVNMEGNEFSLKEIIPNRVLSYPELNFLIQSFRAELPNELFYRESKRIFVTEASENVIIEKINSLDLPDILNGIEFSLNENEVININKSDFKGWSRLKTVFGELLATHLRRQGKIVELSGSQIFHTTFPEEMEEKEQVEIWPGFAYQFIIGTDKIYLLIDPKSRLNAVSTLRNISDKGVNLKEFIGNPLKDICCVRDITKCEERMSPYSRCQLGGTGRTVNVVEVLDREKPSDSFDVTMYLDEINCPTGVLRKEIEKTDKPPTLNAYYSEKDKKPYKFPLERLAPIPKTELIKNRKKRQEFTQKIQPLANTRYNKTLGYQANVQQLLINHWPLIDISDPLSYLRGDSSFIKFDIPDLVFKNTFTGPFASHIVLLEPYQTPKLQYINYISEVGNKTSQVLTDIKRTMTDLLSLDVQCNEITWKDVSKQAKGSCVLVFLPDETFHKKYNETKLELVKKQISLQKLTLSTITSKNKKGHLKNVCLGFFTKSGGIPWKISLKVKTNRLCIGWKAKTKNIPRRGKQAIVIFSAYTEEGVFIKSVALTTENSNYSRDTSSTLINFIKECLEKEEFSSIDIHRDGDFYPNLDEEIINNCKESFTDLSVNFVAITDGIFRIYSRYSGIYSNPQLGTAIKIFDDKYGMATTYIPRNAESRTPQTIFCNFIEIVEYQKRKEILKTIFNLTSGYHGYTRSRIKNPVTVHAVKKIFEILNQKNLPNGFTTSNETEFFV